MSASQGHPVHRRALALLRALEEIRDQAPPDDPSGEPVELELLAGDDVPPVGGLDASSRPDLVLRATGPSGHGPESSHLVQRSAGLWYTEGALERVVLEAGSSEELAVDPDGEEAAWTRIRAFFLEMLPAPLGAPDASPAGDPPPDFDPAAWEERRWEPTYWLIRKTTGLRSFHLGDDFDRERYSVARVVDHDHCVRCMATFSSAEGHEHAGFYHEDEGWLCRACHAALTSHDDR
jgi:hypothetical protein